MGFLHVIYNEHGIMACHPGQTAPRQAWLEFAQDVTFKHAKENALFTLHVLVESSFPLHMDSGL